jgi:hypothetical protein
MKKTACAVLIFTMIIFLVSPLPSDARDYYGGGGHRGGGYGGWWLPWAIIGGAVVLVSNSVALASNSVARASNYYPPYYAPSPVLVRERPPVYVQPAPSVQPSYAERTFVYAPQGQSEEQQAKDRYECHRWAVSQTHYDPTQPTGGMPQAQLNQMRANYKRARGACLEGHGTAAIDYQEGDSSLY